MTMRRMRWLGFGLAVVALAPAAASQAAAPQRSTVTYDSFQKARGAYTLDDYQTRWANPYGLGEMALNDTRNFDGGSFNVSAVPFHVGADQSVFDHLKYIAVSTK